MKKLFVMAVIAMVQLSSCRATKNVELTPAVGATRSVVAGPAGDYVTTETFKLTGIEMADAINDDGTAMIKRPYKWFAGIGRADNKQVAIELAQREAYATISRVLNNAVLDRAERGNVGTNGRVQQAIISHWKQVSASVSKACEPFGDAVIEYNHCTRMYEVVAKVAIRGDRFYQLLDMAVKFKPADLVGAELEAFIEANKAIMEAAKGN